MNYIDEALRKENDNKTIGIIIVKDNNDYITKYSSDNRIKVSEYILISLLLQFSFSSLGIDLTTKDGYPAIFMSLSYVFSSFIWIWEDIISNKELNFSGEFSYFEKICSINWIIFDILELLFRLIILKKIINISGLSSYKINIP